MILKRFMTIVVAISMATSSIPFAWADETPPPQPATYAQNGPDGGSYAAASVSDVIYVPGKASTCAVSGLLWFLAMTATLGNCYKDCGDFVHDACTGKWVIKGEDMAKSAKDN